MKLSLRTRATRAVLLLGLTGLVAAPVPGQSREPDDAGDDADYVLTGRTDTADADTVERVNELVQQLTSDEFAERFAAQEAVTDMGPRAIEPLEQALAETDDVGIKAQLATLLESLRTKDSLAPTLVTLNAVNAPPELVWAELLRQVGSDLHVAGDAPEFWQTASSSRVTIRFERVPFWEAVDELCAATQVGWAREETDDGGRFVLTPETPPVPEVNSGRFKVRVVRITSSRTIRFANVTENDRHENPRTATTFELFSEPGTRFAAAGVPTNVSMTDDAGNELRRGHATFGRVFDWTRRDLASTELNMLFDLDAARSTTATIDGELPVLVWTRYFDAALTVEPDARKVEFLLGDQLATLRDIDIAASRSVDREWVANIVFNLPEGEEPPAAINALLEGLTVRGAVRARSSKGPLQVTVAKAARDRAVLSFEAIDVDPTETHDDHRPIELIFNVPARSEKVTIPFELEEVPLP